MKWIEDSTIREWVCKAAGNSFSATIIHEPWLERYTARVYVTNFDGSVGLILGITAENLEAAKIAVKKILRHIAEHAIALADG